MSRWGGYPENAPPCRRANFETIIYVQQEEQPVTTISFDLPDDAVLSMHVPPDEVGRELRLAAAVKLYELGRLSSGAAARLAGIPRVAFLVKLADYGVDTFRMTEDELLTDVRNA
jgi:predicted HTH domain antitoxin